jgi:hypothetical protein
MPRAGLYRRGMPNAWQRRPMDGIIRACPCFCLRMWKYSRAEIQSTFRFWFPVMRFSTICKASFFLLLLATGWTGSALFLPAMPCRAEAPPLERVGRITFRGIDESSAIEKSRQYPDTYWTINDSGGGPRIFAIKATGETIKPEGLKMYRGIQVEGATNIDWEALALDDRGNMYIGDFGNNSSLRRNLAIYLLREPDPRLHTRVAVRRKIPFSYPEQRRFPEPGRNFDAEALFWAYGHLYLLTKHWTDRHSVLYRFDTLLAGTDNRVSLLATLNFGGPVTAADISDDGSLLAVLTYRHIWLIEVTEREGGLLLGRKYRLPVRAGQCEGVCFSGDRLLITNEQREIFAVQLATLRQHPFFGSL